MTTPAARTPFDAFTRRRFLRSAWPWRSFAYLLSTAPVGAAALLPLMVPAFPWMVALILVVEARGGLGGTPSAGLLAFLLVLGAGLLAVLGPLLALPIARFERTRLRLADTRPMASGHRTPGPGLWSWIRLRYSEAATWRELAYTLLLGSVLPLLTCAMLAWMSFVGTLLVIPPVVAQTDTGSVTMGYDTVDTVTQALPYGAAGLVLLVLLPYPAALVAGTQAALARALLQGRGRDELSAELVEVARSRARIVDAFEAERRRIERDLHDGAQQRLVTLTLQLGLARLDVPEDSPAAKSVADAHEQAKRLMAELRELIRGIHPQVLTDLGLSAALPALAERCPFPVEVRTDLKGRPPAHVEGTAYFVVAEALTNIAKHAEATKASVTARTETGGVLAVEVWDDGAGGADPALGTGLTGLADRVAVMDGTMVMSSPAGGPTLLRVEIPCSTDEPPSA